MKRTAPLVAFALALAAGAFASAPFADAPPLAHTGGFGEPTCAECHAGGGADVAGAAVEISGLPDAYVPGAVYPLTIRVRHSAMQRAGFQLTARVAEGPLQGAQAGGLTATDGSVEIRLAGDSVAYAQHHGARRVAGGGPAEWRVAWTAPATDCGAVLFHVAANAADGDDSPFGDEILLHERAVPVRD